MIQPRYSLLLAFGLLACGQPKPVEESTAARPNIIIFYVDDLGYGDVGCYGAQGVATPNVDDLASRGVKFTDAHCPAATCTPSRYTLLTGRYAFRNKAAILPGDAPLLIDTADVTLPRMLQRIGYTTGVVGKWHLGLGYGTIDWNKHIAPGANEVGFDYTFLLPATGDRVPAVFVENGDVVNRDPADPIRVDYSRRIGSEPLGSEHPELLKMKADPQHSNTIVNGVSRIGYMTGGKDARWIDEDFARTFHDKAVAFIDRAKDKPFFLYYAFQDIHVPRMPNKDFVGKSKLGPRGDAIVQMDWAVGEIVAALRQRGLDNNTLIIFTSDNGPVLDDGYADGAVELVGNHNPTGGLRGGKYSAYEAGTRVPTIVCWPGRVKPAESTALLSQVDLLASLGNLTGAAVAPGIDSENYRNAWLGETDHGREIMLEESFTLALRKQQWKYIQPHTGTVPDWMANKGVEAGLQQRHQLYDLSRDRGEQHNLADSLPEVVKSMQATLNGIVEKQK